MISCKAPCKVNVSLRILGKRPDGFHEVDTVMVPLDLCDVLEFSPAARLEMSCDAPGVPLDESNLVMKAGRLMERELGRPMPWHVRLVKKVPHGAGLGGGSSDAACVLRTLNELERGGLSRERLAELGGEIGSDVGFFIYGAASRCTGRGEKVEPLPEWKDWRPRIVLLKPSFGVSTPDAYRRWSGSRELPGIPYGEQDVDGHVLVNDLERPVFEKHLFLAEMKRWLVGRPGVRGAMMSGSGSTMFAVVEDEGAGRALMEDAARELSGAVKTGDMMWMIEKMYPPMKKQLVASFPGGEASFMETMREKMRAASAVMKERGMVVETYEIGQPAAEHLVKGGSEALVVLPTRMVISMKRPDGVPVKVENTGVLVLVKDLKDKGPWTFIDASRMNANGLRSMFYDLPEKVNLPPVSSRQLPVGQ